MTMHAKRLLRSTSAIAAAGALFAVAHPASAQPAGAQQQQGTGDVRELEEIVVTGSYIRRTTEAGAGAPLSIIDRSDIDRIGASNIKDIIQTLTINTGSQNNPDAFTQNLTTGTSNFNLRGLGVSSTLVLLNGRRQVVGGAPTDDGLLFVDTASLVPQIAIQRLEIVKDGAAALYGSDAVAGVVNFITRNDFEGLELDAEFKAVTDEGASESVRVGGIAGSGFDDGRGHAVVAFEYFDQSELTTNERRLSPKFGPDVSAIGQPGTFAPAFPLLLQAGQVDLATAGAQLQALLTSPGAGEAVDSGFDDFFTDLATVGGFTGSVGIPDPGCPEQPVAEGPLRNSVQSQTPTGLNICALDFGNAFNLTPTQTRFQGFARTRYELSEYAEFYGEFGFARNRSERNNSPTFPTLNTFVIGASDPANSLVGAPPNPFNPFNVDLFGLFRPLGVGEFPESDHDADTFRVTAGFRGDFADDWRYDINFVRGISDFDLKIRDALADRLFFALNGLGGPDCPPGGSGTDPATGQPAVRGQGSCMFFNPFASANLAAPGDTVIDPATGLPVPVANSPEVLDDILAFGRIDFESRLWTGNALVSGTLPDAVALPGGPIGVAIGGQFRREEYGQAFSDNLNRGNFLFINGAGSSLQDFRGTRNTWAGFIEVAFPFTDWLEITAAGRIEDTQTVESSLDPKVSAIVRPMEGLQLRGSFSTSFRAPTILQQISTGATTLAQLTDPLLGNTAFVGVFTEGNLDLEPEESDQFNVGFTYEPEPNFRIEFDFWHFDFSDVIVQEDPQALLNSIAAEQGADGLIGDPRITRAQGLPLLTQIRTEFVNAPSLETNGIDFGMTWQYDAGMFGTITPFIDGTLITEYEIADPSLGEVVDGKGSRNFLNIGAPTPPLRFNAGLTWNLGAHSLFGVARFIDNFEDDQNCVRSDASISRTSPASDFRAFDPLAGQCDPGFEIAKVDEHLTVDLQYTLAVHELVRLPGDSPLTLSAGAINITDHAPPFVNTNSGFATRVHDPRGRLIYARLTIGF